MKKNVSLNDNGKHSFKKKIPFEKGVLIAGDNTSS